MSGVSILVGGWGEALGISAMSELPRVEESCARGTWESKASSKVDSKILIHTSFLNFF